MLLLADAIPDNTANTAVIVSAIFGFLTAVGTLAMTHRWTTRERREQQAWEREKWEHEQATRVTDTAD